MFSRNDLPAIKDGTNVINLDDRMSKVIDDRNTAAYFDSLGI